MGAAVALPEGNGDLRDGGFTVGVQQFGPIGDDGPILLLRAGKEARYIHQGYEGNVEGVAKAHEAGGFPAGINIQGTGQHGRLVGHDAHAAAVHMGKAHDDILGKFLVNFKESPVVHDAADDGIHIVGLVGIVRDDAVEGIVYAAHRIGGFLEGGRFQVVLGKEG